MRSARKYFRYRNSLYKNVPSFWVSFLEHVIQRRYYFLRLCRAGDKWVWSVDGMTLTGEDRSTRRKSFPNATLSTTDFTWTSQGRNSSLCSERPSTNHPGRGMAFVMFLCWRVANVVHAVQVCTSWALGLVYIAADLIGACFSVHCCWFDWRLV